MPTFDAGSIASRITADRSEFTREIEAARADGDKFARTTWTATLSAKADTSGADKALAATQARSDRLGRSAPTITPKASTDAANRKLDETAAKARALGGTSATIKVTADTSSATRNMAKAKADADGLGSSLAKVPLLISGIAATLPAAISLTGVLAGGAAAVAGGYLTAGAAAAGYGVIAKHAITGAVTAYQQVQTLQTNFANQQQLAAASQQAAIAKASQGVSAARQNLNSATTVAGVLSAQKSLTSAQASYTSAVTAGSKARQQEYLKEQQVLSQLSPVQRQLMTQYGALQQQWQALVGGKGSAGSLEAPVGQSLVPFFGAAEAGLRNLPAIVVPASAAVEHIGDDIRNLMSSPTTTEFAQFLGVTGGATLQAGGGFLVNAIKTVEEVLPQFRPLLEDADAGLTHFGQDLASWGGSASTSNGIESFMAFVQKEEPVVEGLFRNLGGAVVALGKSIGAGGPTELKLISDGLGLIAKLPPGIGAPIFDVATSLALLSKFGPVAGILNSVGSGLLNLILKTTGIKDAVQALKDFGTAGKAAAAGEDALAAAQGAETIAGTGAAATEAATALGGLAVAEDGAAAGAGALAAAQAALEAVSPVGWALAGAAAIAALGFILVKNSDQTGDLIKQYQAQDNATGYNVAGYQKLAAQLDTVNNSQSKLAQTVRLSEGPVALARDGAAAYSISLGEVDKAHTAAVTTATKLGTAMSSLGDEYGLSERGAISVAEAAGVSASAWSGSAKAVDQARSKVAQYIVTNDAALPRQQEANALILAMGDESLTTAQHVDAMDTAYRLFVGDLISRQQALAQAKSGLQGIDTSIQDTGVASGATAQAIQSWLGQLPSLLDAVAGNKGALDKLLGTEQDHITALQSMSGLTKAEQQDLAGARKFLDSVAFSTSGLNKSQVTASQFLQQSFLPQLALLGANSQVTRTDMDNLANSVLKTGTQSQSTHDARANLISDLEKAGVSAKNAHAFVDGLTTSIHNIPKSHTTTLIVHGTGSYDITSQQLFPGGGGSKGLPGSLPPPNAAGAYRGMLVSQGQHGVDDQLTLLQRGEVVVPVPLVERGAVDHLKGLIPGMAAGGVIGTYNGSVPGEGPWADSELVATLTAIEKATASAAASALKSAQAAAAVSGATTTAIGDLPANWRAIASYMASHGYTHQAAAGIAGNILQESGGNPESIGDGGGGLIGWTPLPAGYVTGNAGRDLATQLPAILAYNSREGSGLIASLNRQPTPADAAAYYMNEFERPAKATENAERREAGANAVFKAMGYAGGTSQHGAPAGWAKVGERGPELVHFASGGNTVLPNSLTNRVLSGSVTLPGYAGGAGKITSPNGPAPFSAKERAKDEAKLKADQKELAALTKTATAHIRSMRLPVDRDELYLLEHPGLPAARKKSIEAEIDKQEAAIAKYRKTQTAKEDTLTREIKLLQDVLKTLPKAPAKPVPPGKLPPGIGTGTQAQMLAELAKAVTGLASLKKTATKKLATLQKPVDEDELYLLEHPGLSKSAKAAVEAKEKKDKAALAKYRKTVTGQETTLQDEISLLRSLTGEPTATKYGGAGDTTTGTGDSGTGDSGGTTTTAPTPPGQFVGTLPGAPGSYGGADITGGGTGGLGPGDTGTGVPGAPGAVTLPPAGGGGIYTGQPILSGGGGGIEPLDGPYIGSPVPGAVSGAAFSIAARPAAGQVSPDLAAAIAASAAPAAGGGNANVERLLAGILQATRAAPAQTGGHVGDALSGATRRAYSAATWSAAP